MVQAQKGDVVQVHYAGKLEDGTVFSASSEREPLQFRIGDDQVIPGFEQAVVGMRPGETKTVDVPADKAYGLHDQEKVYVIDRSKLPADVKVGQQYQFNQGDNEPDVVTVTNVSEGSVTLDGNHPLAGRDLIFDIRLLDVV